MIVLVTWQHKGAAVVLRHKNVSTCKGVPTTRNSTRPLTEILKFQQACVLSRACRRGEHRLALLVHWTPNSTSWVLYTAYHLFDPSCVPLGVLRPMYGLSPALERGFDGLPLSFKYGLSIWYLLPLVSFASTQPWSQQWSAEIWSPCPPSWWAWRALTAIKPRGNLGKHVVLCQSSPGGAGEAFQVMLAPASGCVPQTAGLSRGKRWAAPLWHCQAVCWVAPRQWHTKGGMLCGCFCRGLELTLLHATLTAVSTSKLCHSRMSNTAHTGNMHSRCQAAHLERALPERTLFHAWACHNTYMRS